jgi:hypothetical protein
METVMAIGQPLSLGQRTRAVRLAAGTVRVVGSLAVLGALGQAWVILSGRYLFTFGGAGPRADLDVLPAVTQADFLPSPDTVFLTDIPSWIRLLSATPVLIQGAILAVSAVQMTQIVRHVANGRAFARPVLRAFNVLTLALLGGGILQGILATTASAVVSSAIPEFLNDRGIEWESLGFSGPDWPIMIILLGAISSAVSIAFTDGARLQDEAEGVV